MSVDRMIVKVSVQAEGEQGSVYVHNKDKSYQTRMPLTRDLARKVGGNTPTYQIAIVDESRGEIAFQGEAPRQNW